MHDIGHLVSVDSIDSVTSIDNNRVKMIDTDGQNLGIEEHESIGAEYLRRLGFPNLVCHLVTNHVASKRYLCTIDAQYQSKLSASSMATLKLQGGLMSDYEISNFLSEEFCELYINIRHYDDSAKTVDFFTEHTFNTNLDYVIEIMKNILLYKAAITNNFVKKL